MMPKSYSKLEPALMSAMKEIGFEPISTMVVDIDGDLQHRPIDYYDCIAGRRIPVPKLRKGEMIYRTIGSDTPKIIKVQ